MNLSNTPTVATPSPRMAELEAKRALCRSLLGGTAAMVAAGKTWLPQHPGESDGNFHVRLTGNTLTHFLEQAVSKATNRIMAKEIGLTDIPPEIELLLEDIDLQGRDLNAFSMDVLKSAFADGVTYILCDKPNAAEVKTVADEKAAGIRPYAIHVQSCCLLEPMSEIINGIRTLTRVRIMECTMVPDGKWGYTEKEHVRVLIRQPNGLITYEIHEEQERQGTIGKEWVVIEEGATAMKRIALVPVYTNRVGYMEGLPPFQATAELNLEHWRSKSEQLHALSWGRFAMVKATGVSDEWVPNIGPSIVLRSSDPDADFGLVECTGAGLDQGWKHLEGITAQIDTASANLRVENGGRVSATAAALDSEEGCAGLKAVAESFGDSLELMLSYFAEMMGLDSANTGDVEVNSDMGSRHGSDTGMQELGKMRAMGDISRASYIKSMIWRNELQPDFDIDANNEEIGMEGPPEPTSTLPVV